MIWTENAGRVLSVSDGTGGFVPLAAGILTRTDLYGEDSGGRYCYFDAAGSETGAGGARRTGVAFTGRRVVGDPAQDRIFAVFEAGGRQEIGFSEWDRDDPLAAVRFGNAAVRFRDSGGAAEEAREIRFSLIFLVGASGGL